MYSMSYRPLHVDDAVKLLRIRQTARAKTTISRYNQLTHAGYTCSIDYAYKIFPDSRTTAYCTVADVRLRGKSGYRQT